MSNYVASRGGKKDITEQNLGHFISHMIPFVVTGGLLIAVALSLGGTPTPEGLSIPEDSFWNTLNELGGLAFSLMILVLSGYIAVGIADRPGLAPGLIIGLRYGRALQ